MFSGFTCKSCEDLVNPVYVLLDQQNRDDYRRLFRIGKGNGAGDRGAWWTSRFARAS